MNRHYTGRIVTIALVLILTSLALAVSAKERPPSVEEALKASTLRMETAQQFAMNDPSLTRTTKVKLDVEQREWVRKLNVKCRNLTHCRYRETSAREIYLTNWYANKRNEVR